MLKKLLAVSIITLMILGAGCVGNSNSQTGAPSEEATPSESTIKIGALLDLSGPLSSHGIDIKNNLELGTEDINKYFKENNMPYKVEILAEDTKVDPNLALQKIQSLKSKGVNAMIGPMASSEVKNILAYTKSNKVIAISPSSTAAPPLIGVVNPDQKKYVYRFVASDDLQGQAIAKEVADLGITDVVIVYRGDAWGKGLSNEVKKNLPSNGVTIKKVIEYPSNPSPSDWSPYISTMENEVGALIKSEGADKVGVIYLGFEEGSTLLSQISDDSVLLKVKWTGSDGIVKSDKIADVKDKASKVGLYSTQFESESPEDYTKRYKERFGGTPESYGLISYDALWVLSMAYVETLKANNGKYDADIMTEKIKEVIPKYNNGDYGIKPITGEIVLNKFNDRASGDYAIYKITKDGWVKAGTWKYETKSVEWINK